ncbi:unnamed protein product [Paramecium pentaurelia]|uniref:Cytidyltransferase-like domain-containing protein n=1 Tax=Paramecium pentaurelia TaxID=43138 RepID=A0A8S1VPA1_9CILI|nr:unnamed protein product [Paramecium pentaurelia]
MIAELINQKIIQKIVLVPCGNRKDKQLTDGFHRYKMLQLLVENQFKNIDLVVIDDYELQNGQLVPTYYMLQKMRDKYQDVYFVIGSDLVNSLPNWVEGLKLIAETKFIILNRSSHKINQNAILPPNYEMVQDFEFGISSTEIRKRIKNSCTQYLDCLGILTPEIIEYIKVNNLYQS